MNRFPERLVAGGLLALLAAAFAWLNGGTRVDVNLGLFRLSGVALPIVVFGAFLFGMLTLFFASLKAELRTQRMLRRYREALGAESTTLPTSESDATDGARKSERESRAESRADPRAEGA